MLRRLRVLEESAAAKAPAKVRREMGAGTGRPLMIPAL